ncbi:MAG TPA: hypothetical protein EYP10_00630 [Armatimonadetes bacterium]|nr:hypothetical protein [Armatimonadota bacterium]
MGRLSLVIAVALLIIAPGYGELLRMRVSQREEEQWLRWVIPLPKSVRIKAKVQVSPTDVRIRLRDGAGELERSALNELIALFKAKAGVDPSHGSGAFEVLMGVCDAQGMLMGLTIPGAVDLKNLPNSEQAYVIRPIRANRIALTAIDERGVYYSAKTFQQLIEAQFDDDKVTIPLVDVTDWPDIAERGEWGGSATRDIEWFAERKLNLVEAHASLKFDENGKGVATISEDLLKRARLHAVKVVPIIMHLDYLRSTGILERHPEVKGVGERARAPAGGNPIALCFSKPKTVEILADWLSSLAGYEGITDINVWLSEYDGQCECDDCKRSAQKGITQHVLEVQAVGRALQIVRRKHPHIRVRVLLTQGSYPVNDKVLSAAVQSGVQVSYYCGGGRERSSYNSSREPMIYPLLANYAANGNWLGVYPQLTASYAVVCPWSAPQFVKFRMTEFVEKGLQSVCAYVVPDNRLHDFNVTSMAEWSWNAHGRTEREFATAWAMRHKLKDPDSVAEWAVLLGPVGWDIYGAGRGASPFLSSLRNAVRSIATYAKPKLGEGIWRYFKSLKQMNRNLAICERALVIAKRLEAPALITETLVIQGYTKMAKALFITANLVASADLSKERNRLKLQRAMCEIAEAGIQTVRALEDWERATGSPIRAKRFRRTLRITEQIVADVAEALACFGIRDPSRLYRRHRIGYWSSDEFGGRTRMQLQWEITDYITTSGRYQVEFEYTHGRNGLPILRVALAASPKGRTVKPTELSVDKHSGFAGAENRGNIYVVNLANYNPDLRYFIIADIRTHHPRMEWYG